MNKHRLWPQIELFPSGGQDYRQLCVVDQQRFIVTLLYKLHAEYTMRNAQLDEAQAEITIAGRNINNLKYAEDTTLTAESEEELKSHLMKVKEESETSGLNSTFRK